MSSKSEITSMYTELAPEFIAFLVSKGEQIKKLVERTKGGGSELVPDEKEVEKEQSRSEGDEGKSDSPVSKDEPDILNEVEAENPASDI